MKLNNKQKLAQWGSVSALALMAIVFTQCIAKPSTRAPSSSSIEVSNPGGLEAAEAEAPSVGAKDADRILYSMAAVTGIDPATNNTVRNTFNNLKPQLPSVSRLEAVNENQMVTVAKLASVFCDQLVRNGTQRAMVWAGFNLDQNWMTLFPATPTMDRRGDFVELTLKTFWGDGVQDQVVYEESYEALMVLFSQMLEGDQFANPPIAAAGDNATSTQNAARAVCTAALSGAPVWMN